jgi:hypothetical protein
MRPIMSIKNTTVVLVRSAYVLENFAIRSFAHYSGALDDYASEVGVTVESLLQQWQQASYIPLQVERYDGGHHFGPTLGMRLDDASMEITIPWDQILGVLGQQAAKKPIGLIARPASCETPARAQEDRRS